MAYSKVVYIYIDGFDLHDEVLKEKQRHEEKCEFILVKYKGNGAFEYTQNGETHSGLPPIDKDTKTVLTGHGLPKKHRLSQLATGGGLELNVQTIADAIAKTAPAGESLRIAVRGCYTGVGRNRNSHEDSFAGQLFAALLKKGFNPEISASLSAIRMMDTIQFEREIPLRKARPFNSARNRYDWFAKEAYLFNLDKLKAYRKFKEIRDEELIFDYRAQGSKVRLTHENETVKAAYDHGNPYEPFDVNRLNDPGKAHLAGLLAREARLAQKVKAKWVELRKILNAFEKEYPDIKQYEDYIHLKQFLLEDYYYIETTILENLLVDSYLRDEPRYKFLIERIKANEILSRFEMHQSDIEEISADNVQGQVDLNLAYWQFGLDIVLGKVDHPSPLSLQELECLDEPTQEKLLIALGKKMMRAGYTLDESFLNDCMRQIEENSIGMVFAPRAPVSPKISMLFERDIQQIEPWMKKVILLLDTEDRRKLAVELDRKKQNLPYNRLLVWGYEDKIAAKLEATGRRLIQEGYSGEIQWEKFNTLYPEEQTALAILISRWSLECPLSEDDELLMNTLLAIVRKDEEVEDTPQPDAENEKEEGVTVSQKVGQSQIVSSCSFFAPPVNSDAQLDKEPMKPACSQGLSNG